MASKKKSKKGSISKRTANKKITTTKRAKKGRPAKGTANEKRAARGRKALAIQSTAKKKSVRKRRTRQTGTVNLDAVASPSGLQSGDLQGVSNEERADSESVDELLEEGNASEAGIVSGVEQAEDDAEGEVRTHEVPEDDVPEEYLDKE